MEKVRKRDIIYSTIIIVLLLLYTCSTSKNYKIEKENSLYKINLKTLGTKEVNKTLSDSSKSTTKGAIITTQKDLILYNKELKARIDFLEKELKLKPKEYVKWKTIIESDTIYLAIKDNQFSFDSTYSTGNYKKLSGKIKDGSVVIEKDEIGFTGELVITENKGKIVASVITKHPLISTSGIEAVELDKNIINKYTKKQRFVIGPTAGIGINTNLNPYAFIGLGLTFKLIKF